MRIQERDEEILKACYGQQFLKFDHIRRYFFDGSAQAASRRVSLLSEAGYVKMERLPKLSSIRFLRLTELGRRAALQSYPLIIPQLRKISVSTYVHDSTVTDVRFRILSFWNGAWIPERALKISEYPQIPDGVILFPSGKKVAVEVENSPKGRARYLRLWSKWKGTGTLLVLYVATSKSLYELLKRYLASGPEGVAFGLVNWEELQAGKPTVWTPRGELDLFARREF